MRNVFTIKRVIFNCLLLVLAIKLYAARGDTESKEEHKDGKADLRGEPIGLPLHPNSIRPDEYKHGMHHDEFEHNVLHEHPSLHHTEATSPFHNHIAHEGHFGTLAGIHNGAHDGTHLDEHIDNGHDVWVDGHIGETHRNWHGYGAPGYEDFDHSRLTYGGNGHEEYVHGGYHHSTYGHEGYGHDGYDHGGFGHVGYDHGGIDHVGYNDGGANHVGYDHGRIGNFGYVHSGAAHVGYHHGGIGHVGYDHGGIGHGEYDHSGIGHFRYDHDGIGHGEYDHSGIGHFRYDHDGIGHGEYDHSGIGHFRYDHGGIGHAGYDHDGIDHAGYDHSGIDGYNHGGFGHVGYDHHEFGHVGYDHSRDEGHNHVFPTGYGNIIGGHAAGLQAHHHGFDVSALGHTKGNYISSGYLSSNHEHGYEHLHDNVHEHPIEHEHVHEHPVEHEHVHEHIEEHHIPHADDLRITVEQPIPEVPPPKPAKIVPQVTGVAFLPDDIGTKSGASDSQNSGGQEGFKAKDGEKTVRPVTTSSSKRNQLKPSRKKNKAKSTMLRKNHKN